jgi:catechol 2,3-dioxygenase-like lactoylglutathione lyase family enzyme
MPNKVLGIHHVQLTGPPGCEPDARAFYVGILGLEEIPKPKGLRGRGGVWFRTPNADLHIGAKNDDTPPEPHRHLALQVENAAAWRTILKLKHVRVEDAPEVAGCRRFFCYDPFGNKIEILEITA